MSACERLSDRMPLAAAGQPWTADERAHLEECPDCAAEWTLFQAARELGVGVGDGLHAHHITERVLGRLRADRTAGRTRRWGYGLAGLAAAAAVVVAVWTGPTRGRGTTPGVDVAANLVLPELDSLGASELEVLLQSMDRPMDEGSIDLTPPVPSDLEGEELDGVLEALEG
jgi:hypothetical protein